jgi:hypothetical protein
MAVQAGVTDRVQSAKPAGQSDLRSTAQPDLRGQAARPQRLNINKIARDLAASREALNRMAADGIAIYVPYSGWTGRRGKRRGQCRQRAPAAM